MRAALRERRDALVAALGAHFGDRVSYVLPEGGYFLWIRLPGVDCDALADRAARPASPS